MHVSVGDFVVTGELVSSESSHLYATLYFEITFPTAPALHIKATPSLRTCFFSSSSCDKMCSDAFDGLAGVICVRLHLRVLNTHISLFDIWRKCCRELTGAGGVNIRKVWWVEWWWWTHTGDWVGGRWEACFSRAHASIQFLSPHGVIGFLFRQEVLPEETAVPLSGGSIRIEKTPGALPSFTPHTDFISYIYLTAAVSCFIAHRIWWTKNQVFVVHRNIKHHWKFCLWLRSNFIRI